MARFFGCEEPDVYSKELRQCVNDSDLLFDQWGKRCKENQKRNPETGRCKKVKRASKKTTKRASKKTTTIPAMVPDVEIMSPPPQPTIVPVDLTVDDRTIEDLRAANEKLIVDYNEIKYLYGKFQSANDQLFSENNALKAKVASGNLSEKQRKKCAELLQVCREKLENSEVTVFDKNRQIGNLQTRITTLENRVNDLQAN